MPDILLKNASGEDVVYENVNAVNLRNTNGGTETFVSNNLIKNQVQADWDQTDETAVDFIKNKPETFESEAELPEVTEADNGKVLGVVNGLWSKMNAPSGSESGVLSWNDLTDKPFYAEESWQELMPSSILPFAFEDGLCAFFTNPTTEMLEMYQNEWSKARVVWDGVEYECEPKMFYGVVKAVGNVEAVEGTGDSGEPFAILVDDGTLLGSPTAVAVSIEDTLNQVTTATHTIGASLLVEKVYPIDSKFIDKVLWDKISDKPFYDILPGMVISEGTVNCINEFNDNLYYATVAEVDLIANVQYAVTWDDTTYYLTTQGEGESIILTCDDPNFMIVNGYIDGSTMIIGSQGTHTYTITTNEEAVKKLDSKYLPNNIGLPEYSSSGVDDGKILKINGSTPTWQIPDSGLPTVDGSYNNKVLKVVNGVWAVADEKEEIKELPTISDTDNGKFLRVVNGVVAWSTIQNAEEVQF